MPWGRGHSSLGARMTRSRKPSHGQALRSDHSFSPKERTGALRQAAPAYGWRHVRPEAPPNRARRAGGDGRFRFFTALAEVVATEAVVTGSGDSAKTPAPRS
jgi:hypothetical protein